MNNLLIKITYDETEIEYDLQTNQQFIPNGFICRYDGEVLNIAAKSQSLIHEVIFDYITSEIQRIDVTKQIMFGNENWSMFLHPQFDNHEYSKPTKNTPIIISTDNFTCELNEETNWLHEDK